MNNFFGKLSKLRRGNAEILIQVGQTIAMNETLGEMLSSLVEIMTVAVDADRGSIFLHDSETEELYSSYMQGSFQREIRVRNNTGVIGHVFTSQEGIIVHDAYENAFFDRSWDEKTGYKTNSILCAPIKTAKGETMGVAQCLNKNKGEFTEKDLELLEAIVSQATIALQSTQFIEHVKKARLKEAEFFDVVSDVTSEIDLGTILGKVMSVARKMLNAERSTLFLNDEKTNELFSKVGEGLGTEIRLPNHLGIAGTVFTTGKTVNIPHAYADLRFNPAFDRQTNYFTRSILCVPVATKAGKTIGVTQVLNKRGGPFTEEDESRLKAFTAQVAMALEHAKLFDDLQNMQNYSKSILESMSNGLITLGEDGKIITCNAAGLRIMKVSPQTILYQRSEDFFAGPNSWILEKIKKVEESHEADVVIDAELEFGTEKVSANVTILPLFTAEEKKLGTMIVIEDISSEKRMKSTMSRYMDPELADQLLDGGESLFDGKSVMATVLFSDIRGFTTLTEELGAHGTVSLLNEYFTIMVDCIQREGGMLDKFIGDAIMAAFGLPIAHDDDEDRAMRCAIDMLVSLNTWNKERVANGKRTIDIGIGLNTDWVVSGNIGSPKRMDYTLIGDGVNLAARLESACKQYNARILISEYTYNKLRGTYRTREADRVIVKGKTEPVGIHEVLDYHTDETFPNLTEVLNQFKNGLGYYRQTNWTKAIETFQSILQLNPGDKLSQIYIDRCQHLRENPPEDGWDGVWVMTSK